ncbi:MAG: hypothetical protein V1738_01340 [Patescibacteria group bacterium]
MNLIPSQNQPSSVASGNQPPVILNSDHQNQAVQESGESFGGLRVSLMPAGEEEAGGGIKRWLLALAIILFVETVLIGGGYLFMANKEADLQARRAELDQAIAASSQKIKETENVAVEASQFGKRARIADNLLDAHLRWTLFFEHLHRVTKPTVTFLNFSGDVASRTVSMDAYGLTYRDVAEQIVALREDDAVMQVITTSATARTNELGEIEGVGFSLVLVLEDYMWSPNVSDMTETIPQE